jgi:hypothetical protein
VEYFNNILCVPAQDYYHEYSDGPGKGDVVEEHCVSYDAYKKQVVRGNINVIRQGKGEGNYALIALDSIPPKYRGKLADGRAEIDAAKHRAWIAGIRKDYQAVEYYMNFRYTDGSAIPTDRIDNIMLWSNNASILNCIGSAFKSHTAARAKLGKRPLRGTFFKNIATLVGSNDMMNAWQHNLPTNPSRLQKKYEAYVKNGYYSLIKMLKGNDNAVKINDKLLRLFEFISTLPTRPYTTRVVEVYEQFMAHERELVDTLTGEFFEPSEYLDKNGKIIHVTESAVWQRLSNPARQAVLDKKRLGAKDYNDLHGPHHHRKPPVYSFSKISMDDRDLIWKDKRSKVRPKAYYAYDVQSGCRIGSAYSMKKDAGLFLECLRDMLVFADRNGLGIPMEVEVEHHLVKQFEPVLKQIFPVVHFCAAGNSQEKRAEHLNRFVKYQFEKNAHPGVGRWWLKSRYNRIGVDKVDDEFKQTMRDVDVMIVEDIQNTLDFNNSLHPNQKMFPGKTRMQVLVENINPNLPKFQRHLIYRHIGNHTETSIVRNQYLSVDSAKYMLPGVEVMELLAPNNREVDAYWLPNDDGITDSVYLYQNGKYLCEAEKITRYNEAIAERTQDDWDAKARQDAYMDGFRGYTNERTGELVKLEVSKPAKNTDSIPVPEVVPDRLPEPEPTLSDIDYKQKAIDGFFTI